MSDGGFKSFVRAAKRWSLRSTMPPRAQKPRLRLRVRHYSCGRKRRVGRIMGCCLKI